LRSVAVGREKWSDEVYELDVKMQVFETAK